ncbi:MAG: DUF937 domain-containing protein, partial [Hyphomicrobiales bacterium]|nr:DUF937 domain-containing protein [Hyphomicrobiales bacterium]
MNLYDMISAAQNGQAMANLGRQYGLNEKQSADALRYLLPAFSSGLKRNTASPEGLEAFLGALSGGQHARYYEDMNIFADPGTMADGNNILGHMFGSKDVSRAVAERAAEQSGIAAEVLKAMLPYIASMIMGAFFKQGQNPIGDILGQVLGGGRGPAPGRGAPAGAGDNPFGPLAEILAGGARDPEVRQAPGSLPTSG